MTVEERLLAIEQALSMPYFVRNSDLRAELAATKAAHETTAAQYNDVLSALGSEMTAHKVTQDKLAAEIAARQEVLNKYRAETVALLQDVLTTLPKEHPGHERITFHFVNLRKEIV